MRKNRLIICFALLFILGVTAYAQQLKLPPLIGNQECAIAPSTIVKFYRMPDTTTVVLQCTTDTKGQIPFVTLPSTGSYRARLFLSSTDSSWYWQDSWVEVDGDTAFFPEMLVGNGVSPNDAAGFLDKFCVALEAPGYDTISDAAFISQFFRSKKITTGSTSPALAVATGTYDLQQSGVNATLVGAEFDVGIRGPYDTVHTIIGAAIHNSLCDNTIGGQVRKAIGAMCYIDGNQTTGLIPDTSISLYALTPTVGTVKYGVYSYGNIYAADSIWSNVVKGNNVFSTGVYYPTESGGNHTVSMRGTGTGGIALGYSQGSYGIDFFAGGTTAQNHMDSLRFTRLTIPISAPSNPVAGAMFIRGTAAADTLFVYDGVGWRKLILGQ